MKTCLVSLASLAILLSALAWEVSGETCRLELKRVPQLDPRSSQTWTAATYLYRNTYAQRCYSQIGGPERSATDTAVARFSRLVRKQPEKYEAPHPFRGVVKLGSREYAFVLDAEPVKDSAPPAKASTRGTLQPELLRKAVDFNRLYFDLNGNGDLTDDGVIEALGSSRSYPTSSYASREFPRVDLTIDVEGTKAPYAFRLSVYSRASTSYSYAYVSLYSAAYREGTITVNGKPRNIVLLDYNSNGRFDDEFGVRESGRVYPSYGDMLMVDPDPDTYAGSNVSGDDFRQYVSKLTGLDDRFYDLKITPAGDELTLTASSVPVGYVTNPHEGFRAVVYGDQGVLKIAGGKAAPIPLPEGQWRLMSYTITRTEKQAPPQEPADDGQPQPPVPSIRYHRVSARGTSDCRPIEVRDGQTAALPFGPAYKPVVTLSSLRGAGSARSARLGLSLIGAGGETCSGLIVNSRRPEKPEFTITSPDGKEIARGNFEYG
jgi:hypothetical protein